MDVETNTQIQEVRDAIVILRELNADEKVRREAHYREKRLHDEATALGNARREGEAIGIKKGEAQSIVQMISSIMHNSKCSLENALHITGKTMEDYQNSMALLDSVGGN